MEFYDPRLAFFPSSSFSGEVAELQPFYLWLHIEKYEQSNIHRIVSVASRLGCKLILVSGDNPVFLHDKIDEIILDEKIHGILTMWKSLDIPETFDEFLQLNLENDNSVLRVFTCVGESLESELKSLGVILGYVEDSIRRNVEF